MKNHSIAFWSFLSVALFTSLLVGCDVELLEYEDDNTYALLDRPAMAPNALDLISALDTIESGVGDVAGAFVTILGYFGVVLAESDISAAPSITISDVAGSFSIHGVPISADTMTGILKQALGTDFDRTQPKNAALAALVYSLRNRGITTADQVNKDTQVSTAEFVLLVMSVHQSTGPEDVNELADLISIPLDIPQDLESFIESITGIDISVPHQGEALLRSR